MAASEVWPGKEPGQVLSGSLLLSGPLCKYLGLSAWEVLCAQDTPGLSRRLVGSAGMLTLQGQLSACEKCEP